MSKDNSFTLGNFTGFAVSQHMFNIYDGPGDEDSNAYLDIKKYDLGKNSAKSVYKDGTGYSQGLSSGSNDNSRWRMLHPECGHSLEAAERLLLSTNFPFEEPVFR